jgi:hypothetical protein
VRIFLFAMLALSLGFGCGGGGEEKPAVDADADADTAPPETGEPDTGRTDTGSPDSGEPPPPTDLDDDGFTTLDGDCDDTNPTVHPAADEVCDSIDNDCDGEVDEDIGSWWFMDYDDDGFGDAERSYFGCDPLPGHIEDNTDCDDTDLLSHPGAEEVCDEADNDCDGDTDEDVTVTVYFDGDHDGFGDAEHALEICTMPFGYADNDDDCDDGAAAAYPGATEVCDGIDNDCDDAVDEDDADDAATWFADADEDGFGDPDSSTAACSAPEGFVSNNTDCNDTTDAIHPDATEVCDDLDNDCDDAVDEGVLSTFYRDADGDGHGDAETTTAACDATTDYVDSSDDCDDGSAARAPGLAEVCDDIDNDCDDAIDEGLMVTYYRDWDGDGYGDPEDTIIACSSDGSYVTNDDDCDDSDEAFTSIEGDADCDGVLTADDCDDEDETLGPVADDGDCDSVLIVDDCDDADPLLGAIVADGDCDGTLTADDCDDTDPDIAGCEVFQVFGYTGSVETFDVPAGVISVFIEAEGAKGWSGSLPGGEGGFSSGTLPVSSGDELYIYVGGQGTVSTPAYSPSGAGWNGGGLGQNNGSGSVVGGGGGASDVRLIHSIDPLNLTSLESRIIVAAGGGGSTNNGGVYGGDGGGLVGESGGQHAAHHYGRGGTQSSGGGEGGGFGYGGNAEGWMTPWNGGGGGGWYGGGVSTAHSGGGGGSSYIGGVTDGIMEQGGNNDDGRVVIHWTEGP